MTLRKAKVCAVDRLLLERFGAKTGRGMAAANRPDIGNF